ncbi:MAG: FCSD flavin-binding domain-containing protein [Pseudomonadales bacterium]
MIKRRRFLQASVLVPLSFSVPGRAKPRVVIVGGGFGGATAAGYIKKLAPSAEVSLVEPARAFITCPFSNLVVAGKRDINTITFDYTGLQAAGVRHIATSARSIDPKGRLIYLESNSAPLACDFLVLSPGIELVYDSIEGTGVRTPMELPHAWKAGYQTLRLRSQLEDMKQGGVFVIAAPDNPYRCPPGPYERASLVAEYFKRHNPRAKIIIVDAKDNFTKKALFQEGWNERYPGMIDWVPVSQTGTLRRVDEDKVFYTDFDEFPADVGNLIPPQRAGAIVTESGLDGGRGWCEVDPGNFESTLASNVYILGDAVNAAPMPKSAFSANNQAKVCAASIAARINGTPPLETFMMNTCYSLIGEDYGISISGVYKTANERLVAVPDSEDTSPLGADKAFRQAEAKYTHDWYRAITADTFIANKTLSHEAGA